MDEFLTQLGFVLIRCRYICAMGQAARHLYSINSLNPLPNILSHRDAARFRSLVIVFTQRLHLMTCPRPPCLEAGRRATNKSIHNRSIVSPLGASFQDVLEIVCVCVSEWEVRARGLVLALSGGIFGYG